MEQAAIYSKNIPIAFFPLSKSYKIAIKQLQKREKTQKNILAQELNLIKIVCADGKCFFIP
jgi:hypothetical protein